MRRDMRRGATAPMPPVSTSDADPVASPQGADAIELGLLAGVLDGTLTHLVAFVEQLDLLELLESLRQRGARILELTFELVGRSLEVVAPRDRGLGIGRVGKVRRIVDSGTLLLGEDFTVQVPGHAIELGDHAFDLHDLPPLFVDLKL